ncbi:MAG: hypothetical protein IJJ69_08590 [Oscillospiraceae bacterium]|nr:hypothetical protein [Oscillospiraceae bacterium]
MTDREKAIALAADETPVIDLKDEVIGYLSACQLPPLTLTSFAKKWGLVTIR